MKGDYNMKCVQCGKEKPIYNKKRQLCQICYMHLYHKGELENLTTKDQVSGLDNNKVCTQKKFEFVWNYFTHSKWYFKPITFQLSDNKYLIPDFYDYKNNVFIKVIPSRQIFSLNKKKYEEFGKLYPNLKLELRTPNGNELDPIKPNWGEVGACTRRKNGVDERN